MSSNDVGHNQSPPKKVPSASGLSSAHPPNVALPTEPGQSVDIVTGNREPLSIRAPVHIEELGSSSRRGDAIDQPGPSSAFQTPTGSQLDPSSTSRTETIPPPPRPSPPPATPAQHSRPPSCVHLHSHSLEIILSPPPALFREPIPHSRNREYMNIPNPDRARLDQALTLFRKYFPPSELLTFLPMSDKTIQVPVDLRGNADLKQSGFQVLGPSKLKRQNNTPFLHRIEHPNTRSSSEWYLNSSAWDTRNWIHAAVSLDPKQAQTRKANYRPEKQKIYMESGLKGCWMEEDMGAETDASLRLVLDINVYLDYDTIFEPSSDISNDLTGLILHSLIPSPTAQYSMSGSERRADSLRHFFACLRPAPPVAYARSLQPANMVSKLLPFQNRTVALLAQREKGLTRGSGPGTEDPQGFWITFELGPFGKVAFRRLTGELVRLSSRNDALSEKQRGKAKEEPTFGVTSLSERRQLPVLMDLSEVRGTMLCEEMGKSLCDRLVG